MTAGPDYYDLVREFETLRLVAYLCPAGYWTAGWGHTATARPGMVIDRDRAEELLIADTQSREKILSRMSDTHKIVLVQPQFDALMSLCFNLKGGPAALPRRAPRLWGNLQAGRMHAAAYEFLDIVKGAGQVWNGLIRRRRRECALFRVGEGRAECPRCYGADKLFLDVTTHSSPDENYLCKGDGFRWAMPHSVWASRVVEVKDV